MTNNTNNSTMNSSNGSLTFLTNNSNEEISTIFVVGFPDDMQEREFQNMFIFSPGFEAATLKIPSIKDQEEEITSPTTTTTTTTSAPPSSSTTTTTTNTTCSSFSNNNNNNSNNINNNNNNNGRKQIIGFAKFRTRFEALEAKDTLSGRRVDAEKGSVLKAEMAKKNLHTKRGLSSDQPISQQQPQQQQQQQHPTPPPPPIVPISTSSYPIISQQQQQQPSLSSSKRFSLGPPQAPSAAYEAFHSVPPALPSDLVPPNELSYPDYYPDLFSPGGTPIAPSFHESVFASRAPPPPPQQSFIDTRSASMGDIFNVKPSMSSSSRLPSGFNPGHRFSSKSNILDMDHPTSPTERSTVFGAPMFLPPPSLQQQQQQQQSTSSTSTPVPTSSNSQQQQSLHSSTINTTTTNSFLPQHPTAITPQQQQQFSSPPPPTATGGLNSVLEEIYPLQLPDPENNTNDVSSRLGGLSISTSSTLTTTTTATNNNNNNNNNTSHHGSGFTSPTGITSPTNIISPTTHFHHFGVLGVHTNPADQNPPCNTLYVGNLPPNANEEELKTMFLSCMGYQRLSFRNKSNGPMCFVEFEDISCASKAMQDLYGSPLSNSVKGGIRLSFSKNPLGVRQNASTLEQ